MRHRGEQGMNSHLRMLDAAAAAGPALSTGQPGLAGHRETHSAEGHARAEPARRPPVSGPVRGGRGGVEPEQVPVPRGEFHVQPVDEVVAVTVISDVIGGVGEQPTVTPEVGPWGSHPSGCGGVAEIHHDQPPGGTRPAPGDEVLEGAVPRPSRPVT